MPQNPYYIQPASPLRGFQQLQEGIGSRIEYDRAKSEETRKQQIRQKAVGVIDSGNMKEISKMLTENSWLTDELKKSTGLTNDLVIQKMVDGAKRILINKEDPVDVATETGEFALAQGENAEGFIAFGEQAQEDPEGAMKEAEMTLALYDQDAWESLQEMREGKEPETSDIKVGAQEILEDGTIIQSTQTGPVVYNKLGEKVKGKEAAAAVEKARAQKVKNLREAAGQKRTAALEAESELKGKVEAGVVSAIEAAKISIKAFDRLEKINKNISNLEEGIRLLDEGAETGAVTGLLPSARAASVKLDNLQGRLGLDVLHSTTFGALSAAELRFALSTALPKRLDKTELKEWISEKKIAQEKLADYLESAAIYLGTPGNTVAGWMEKQKEKRYNPKTAPPQAVEFLRNNPQQKDAFQEKYGYLPEGM